MDIKSVGKNRPCKEGIEASLRILAKIIAQRVSQLRKPGRRDEVGDADQGEDLA